MNRFELYPKSVIRKEVDALNKKDEFNTAAEEVAEPSSESKSEKGVSEPFTIYIIPWVHKDDADEDEDEDKNEEICKYLQYSYDYFLLILCLESIPLVKIMRN